MPQPTSNPSRRDFLKLTASASALSALSALPNSAQAESRPTRSSDERTPHEGATLNRVAFPMGGIGTGMLCLEGTGALSGFALPHHPDVFNEPGVFAALSVQGSSVARVLEGPVPAWKLFGQTRTGMGSPGATYGLPRFDHARFSSRYPFGTVSLTDDTVPLTVEITGWSPFIPGNADDCSLPVAALEYRFHNPTSAPVSAVFSFNARNLWNGPITSAPGGFVLGTAPEIFPLGTLEAAVDDPAVRVNHAWFRGDWWDPMTMAWHDVAAGSAVDRPPVEGDPPAGASLFVPFTVAPGADTTIVLRLTWYVGDSNLRVGSARGATMDLPEFSPPPPLPQGRGIGETYKPWYAGRFADHAAVSTYWREHYAALKERTRHFTECFYDSTLPPEVIESVAGNLSIFKSPTMLRQTDGRLWLWEGCDDRMGSCAGSCTHVWNYAQATAHLFPDLERSLRESEFEVSQDEHGFQMFRTLLPIRPPEATSLPAADGQLGGIMKVYRDWRISGDEAWLKRLWPRVKASLDYCIARWDPDHTGWLMKAHHNTYDIEFRGGDGMCTSFYLGALRAATLMSEALHDRVPLYETLYTKGVKRAGAQLYNGEYFIQLVDDVKDAQADAEAASHESPEEVALVAKEGPKYQYGTGCLSDGVIGSWMALVCGVGQVLDFKQVSSHVAAVHRYNFKADLSTHANCQRPSYATGHEGGLLLCTWPKGGKPSLPFVYSDEVWTGIEYQVASHLMLLGMAPAALEILRATRSRYDGRVRNPYDEYECGHWYGRALSSYALLQGMSGARYDAVERTLYLKPAVTGDFRAFLSTATGYGTVGLRQGKPFLEVRSGTIEVKAIRYSA